MMQSWQPGKGSDPPHSLPQFPGGAQGAGQGLSQSCLWDLPTAPWSLLSTRSCRDTACAKRSWHTFPGGAGTCSQPCSPQDLGFTQISQPRTRSRLSLPAPASSCKGQAGFWDGAGGCSWQKSLEFLPGWCLRVTNTEPKSVLLSESCTHSKIQPKLKLSEQLLNWAPANAAGTWRGGVGWFGISLG